MGEVAPTSDAVVKRNEKIDKGGKKKRSLKFQSVIVVSDSEENHNGLVKKGVEENKRKNKGEPKQKLVEAEKKNAVVFRIGNNNPVVKKVGKVLKNKVAPKFENKILRSKENIGRALMKQADIRKYVKMKEMSEPKKGVVRKKRGQNVDVVGDAPITRQKKRRMDKENHIIDLTE